MRRAITATGMISSVGWTARICCASIRAGLRRPVDLDYFASADFDTHESVPLVAYPIRGVTEGFLLAARWVRMATLCLDDLIRSARHPSDASFWEDTALCIALPSGRSERFDTAADPVDTLGDMVLDTLRRARGEAFLPAATSVVTAGHAGAAYALAGADALLEAGDASRVVVLAVDSYLDPLTLDWLAASGRLGGEGGAGLRPGEAAAALLLESSPSSREVMAYVDGVSTAHAPHADEAEATAALGRTLAQVCTNVLDQSAAPGPFEGDMVLDLNGEQWRARCFGYATFHLADRLRGDVQPILPALSIGEVGAASGAAAVCLAVHAFQRGYARGPHTVVLSTSEEGAVGGICLAATTSTDLA